MKVTIDRAKWSAGVHNSSHGSNCNNALLTEDTKQRCCLGFLGASMGLTDEQALGVSLPGESSVRYGCAWPLTLFEYAPHQLDMPVQIKWEYVLATLNDFEDIDDATRESWIATGFRIVLGVEVEFVGEYP